MARKTRERPRQPSPNAFEALFRANDWRGAWVDGIYDFHHHHSTDHEVLGVAQGSAKVQLGSPQGLLVELEAGEPWLSRRASAIV